MAERRLAPKRMRACSCGCEYFYARSIFQGLAGSDTVDLVAIDKIDISDFTPKPFQCVKCSSEYTHAELLQLGVKSE